MNGTYSRRDFVRLAGLGACSVFAATLVGCGGSKPTTGAATTTAVAGSGLTLVSEGKLTIVTNYGYIPMEWIEDGKPKGFDVDLIETVAKKLGLEPTWLPDQKFDTIIPTIKQGGKADVSIGSITITEERAKEIDFSDPYMDSNQSVVCLKSKKDALSSAEALNKPEVKIAAQAGTTGEEWAKENLTKATIVTLDDAIQTLTGTESGLYDGAVADLPVMQYMCENSYEDLAVCLEIPTGEQYGIVISKDNPELTKSVNSILADMAKDGSMDELKKKWFGDMADKI